jgi:hypothetical protein
MKTKDTIALLAKRIAENPTARHDLAAALSSGDSDKIDRIATALGGSKLSASKQAPGPRAEKTPNGPNYLT